MPAIYGYDFDDRFPTSHSFAVVISPPAKSEPQVSFVAFDPPYDDYWVAWRQDGGIWANHLKPPVMSSDAFEVLADYTGPYDLEADELIYDGGRITLEDPPPPEVSEPGTLVLLSMGTLAFTIGWWRRRR